MTSGASVLAGGVWNSASRILPQIYTLVISVLAARFLGPEGLGRQSFIAFVELSLVWVLTGGLLYSLMRYIGDAVGRGRPEAIRALVAWSWRIEGFAALAGGGILVGAGLLGADPESAWFFAGLACAIGVLHNVPSGLLIGAQRWRAATIAGIVTGTLATVGTFVVLAAGGGITGIFVVEAAVSAINLVWTTFLARRALADVAPRTAAGAMPAQERARLLRDYVRYAALASYGVVLTIVVWRRSEVFFLDHYSTETQIALFSIAFAAMTALTQFPEAAGNVISPAVATLAGAGETERIASGYSRALRLLLLLVLPLTAAAVTLGPETLRLVYGDEFRDTGVVLLVLIAPFPLVPLMNLSKSLLIGLGRLRFPLLVETGAAIVNVALAVALIPRHGAVGAAVATAVAQLSAAVPIFAYARSVAGGAPWRPWELWRAGAASGAAALAAWAGVSALPGAAGVVGGLAAGTAVFAVAAVALHILPPDDAAWLEQSLGHRLRGGVARACRACSRSRVRAEGP